jgi:hypothetical protein
MPSPAQKGRARWNRHRDMQGAALTVGSIAIDIR